MDEVSEQFRMLRNEEVYGLSGHAWNCARG